jgi:glycosyltransferase involved in cell wall biosynthesis
MTAPTVSIIVPTFNRLKYLRPAVDSVLAQSFRDWELIIADDGSDEETRTYLSTLALLPGVKVVWRPHTGNLAAMRNTALREARGEFVAFLDSDDLWAPCKLEAQVRSLRRHRSRNWAYTGFTLVDAAGAARPSRSEWASPAHEGWIFEALLKMDAIIAPSSAVARRGFIEDAGGFDEELPAIEDYDMWLRLAVRSEVDVVREPLVQVRRHTEHYADDITCLEARRSVLEKTKDVGLDRRLDAIAGQQLAQVSAMLATRHAICADRSRLWQTLRQSWPYSWPHRQWWLGAIGATARAYAPAGMRRAARTLRRLVRAHTGAAS